MKFVGKKQKFISLKEAAKFSGYNPDYIGYLIRQGKIPGKKVYSQITWITTEEAIREYQNSQKEKKELTENINPLKFKNQKLNTKRSLFFGWRFGFVIFLIISSVIGIVPIKFIHKSISALPKETKIINFYPQTCLGNWRNIDNVKGSPEVGPEEDFNAFSEINSAIYQNDSSYIVCQDFTREEGIIVENLKENKSFSTVPTEENNVFYETTSNEGTTSQKTTTELATTTENIQENETTTESAQENGTTTEIETTTESEIIIEEEIDTNIIPTSTEEEKENEPVSFFEKFKNYFKNQKVFAQEENENFKSIKIKLSFAIGTDNQSNESAINQPVSNEDLIIVSTSTDNATNTTDGINEILLDLDEKIIIWYSIEGEIWWKLGSISGYPLSNALNNGYFEYDAPFLRNWDDIKKLKIKFEGTTKEEEIEITTFLDSVWVEVVYDEAKETETKPNIVLLSSQKVFKGNEGLEFKFKYNKGENSEKGILGSLMEIGGENNTQEVNNNWNWNNIKIKAEIVNGSGLNLSISPELIFENNGEFFIRLDELSREIRPGKYLLKIKIEDSSTDPSQLTEFEQEFIWGVLAVNVNKSIFLAGESAYIQMAVLDNNGHTVCDSKIYLEIIAPGGSTQVLDIQKSGKCLGDNVTDVPDYYTYYQTLGSGIYNVKLTNLENGYQIFDSFEVRDSVPFDIERFGPTRIYPFVPYQITIRIKANQNFSGEIIETVPKGFDIISGAPGFRLQNLGNEQQLIWQANLEIGQIQELNYEFDAPNISPYLYLLGPLEIFSTSSTIFEETRKWQIAADADTVVILTNTGLTQWLVPDDFTANNTIEIIGGGQGGTNGTVGGNGGVGGKGAYYAKITNISLATGTQISYSIGTGGSGGSSPQNGGDTYFNGANCANSLVCAPGGNSGSSASGTTIYAGGNAGTISSKGGSGAGGAGGPYGIGKAGGNGSNYGGAGGGGAGGGDSTVGGDALGNTPGDGGLAQDGTAGGIGGSPGGSGSNGSGGGGGTGQNVVAAGDAGSGGAGIEWSTHGAGGGGGGGGGSNGNNSSGNGGNGGNGGGYGGGGGGGGGTRHAAATAGTGGNGSQGIIVITYTPYSANESPTITNINLNAGSNIDLIENATTSITATTTVSDSNTYADITSVIGRLYRSGVTSTENCTTDANNCTPTTTCATSSCSSNDCTATCSFDLWFIAEPTDTDSDWDAEHWVAWMQVTDSQSATGTATNSSQTVDVNTLLALEMGPGGIDYGELSVGQSIDPLSKLLVATTTGNTAINANISGTDLYNDTIISFRISTSSANFEFDPVFCYDLSIYAVDSNHFLIPYSGPSSYQGWAAVLEVNTTTWAISTSSVNFEFDPVYGQYSAIYPIDSNHFLVPYSGPNGDGWTAVLEVNTTTWAISTSSANFEFDPSYSLSPAIYLIDSNHFLVSYSDTDDDGRAIVLEVNTTTWAISTSSVNFEFDPVNGLSSAIYPIDSNHFLVPYTGSTNHGWAAVLEVNTTTWAISTSSANFRFYPSSAYLPAIYPIDSNHFLVPYQGPDSDGWTAVLEVNTTTWAISTSSANFEFDPVSGYSPAIYLIDSNHFLVPYQGPDSDGWTAVFEVNTTTWAISTSSVNFEFDPVSGYSPAIYPIDSNHFLVPYRGPDTDGWAAVLEREIITISIIHQRYATSSLNYASTSDGVVIASSSAQLLDFGTVKPTATTSNQAQNIYWGVYVPVGTMPGVYSGLNTISAVED